MGADPEPVEIISFAQGDCPVGTANVNCPHFSLFLKAKGWVKWLLRKKLKFLVGQFANLFRKPVVAPPELGHRKGAEAHGRRGFSANGIDLPERT